MKNIIIDGVEYNLTQVKKEYEILSFKQDSVITDLWTYFDNEGWCRNHKGYPATYPYTLDQMLNNYTTGIAYFIHSVKRLSDGKIFTVGDKVNWVTDFIIKGFTLNGNHCYADVININSLSLIKNPLFTTFDGVDIYLGDGYWVYDYGELKGLQEIHKVNRASQTHTGDGINRKYFSTKEAAEEFILWNKPSLSLKQIEDTVNLHWQDLEKLKEVVKIV